MGPRLIGNSQAIRTVRLRSRQAAKSGCPVLILGPTGSGKELVAGLVAASNGRKGPFQTINCAAIPENLIESILFGHVRGIFTGATKDKTGIFQQVDGGTLFLDEIADLSLSAQAKVLRVLQYGDVMKVGDNTPIHVDVHIVAATNKDLLKEIKEGRFREDLYYRLEPVVIQIPPLCDRLEDVPLIAKYYMKEQKQKHKLTHSALTKLRSYSWPGNVRELFNVLTKAYTWLPSHRKTIQAKDIPITEDVELQKTSSPSPEEKVNEIMRLIDEFGKVTNSDVQKSLGLSSTAAGKWLKRLEGTNLQRHSQGKGTYYTRLVEDQKIKEATNPLSQITTNTTKQYVATELRR